VVLVMGGMELSGTGDGVLVLREEVRDHGVVGDVGVVRGMKWGLVAVLDVRESK